MTDFNLLIILFIVLLLVAHHKATSSANAQPANKASAPSDPMDNETCNQTLPNVESFACQWDGSSRNSKICYPGELLAKPTSNRICNCKASRRFEVPAFQPGTSCPAELESRKYREEFEEARIAFLDEYHPMFLDLPAYAEVPECDGKVAMTGTTKKMIGSIGAKTTKIASTTPTRIATSTKAPVSTAPIPYVIEAVGVVKMPNSYRLTNALRDNCTISISATITGKETGAAGQFAIHLVHNSPAPVPGIGESMLSIHVTDERIFTKFRFNETATDVERKGRLDGTGVELEIRVFEKMYAVLLDGTPLGNFTNDDHPVWATDYICSTGDLKFNNKPTISCATKMSTEEGTINHSEKLDKMGPADLLLEDVKSSGKGALVVYLLKDCQRFDMRVCTHALRYKLEFDEEQNQSHLDIREYGRENQKSEGPIERRIGEAVSNVSMHGNITIGLNIDRGIDMRMHGDSWQKAKMEHGMQKWADYLYNFADFIQILTEDGVEVGKWELEMAPRMITFNGDKKFEANMTSPPWTMEQKLTNWTNGDYVKLHFRMTDKTFNQINLYFYRGYPQWITESIDADSHTGQKMLEIDINSKDGNITSEMSKCNWISLRTIDCKDEVQIIPPVDKILQLQANNEYAIHILGQKNNSTLEYELKMELFDIKTPLAVATYLLPEGPPYYIIEYFGMHVVGDTKSLVLKDRPKFCKKGGANC